MAQTKIQSEQIEDSAVVNARIGPDAVTTAKIADDVGLVTARSDYKTRAERDAE